MNCSLFLALALMLGEPANDYLLPPAPLDEAIKVPELAAKADTSYLVRRWDRAVPLYSQLVAANPSVGFYWYRLGSVLLADGQYEKAIAPFTKANELGAYQWTPLRIVYHGESAWGIAAANARLGRKDEAVRWTRVALEQGLRDIRQFHTPHFSALLEDPEYRQLVWEVDAAGLSRDEGFKLDLKFLVHEAKRLHYDPFRSTNEAELDSMVRAIEADIPTLSDDQLFVRMMGLMRQLGDGHTWVSPKGDQPRLPVQLFVFPEGMYITAAQPAQADLVGAKVLRVGKRTAAEALQAIEPVASRDNPMSMLSKAASLLALQVYLRGLGVIDSAGPVTLEVEDVQGQTRQVELPMLAKPPEKGTWTNRIDGLEKAVPRSQAQRGKMYWFEEQPEEHLVYCQINGIGNEPGEVFKKFCARLFEAVEKPEVEALVVDLRYNGGGNTFENVPLIEGLIRSKKLDQPGRLFVIIGRFTFSAAQNTTSELERRTKAILVGEPTGSCPNFIGENVTQALPYSGWTISVSDLWWQHSMAMDYRIWTNPQIYAPPTAAAFREYRDNAMEAIAKYRASSAAATK